MNRKPVVALAQVSEDVQVAYDYFAAGPFITLTPDK